MVLPVSEFVECKFNSVQRETNNLPAPWGSLISEHVFSTGVVCISFRTDNAYCSCATRLELKPHCFPSLTGRERERCRLTAATLWRQFCAVEGFSVSLVLLPAVATFPLHLSFLANSSSGPTVPTLFCPHFPSMTFLIPHAFTVNQSINPLPSRYRSTSR